MKSAPALKAFVLLLGILVSSALVAQPVPRLLNVQGVLRNFVGEAVNGTYDLTFRIYDRQTGGTKLYEQQATVNITGGVFNVYLGPIPQNFFADYNQAWLEIQVAADPPLPRRPLTSVGYAFMAERAQECVNLLSAATDLECTECVSADEVSFSWAMGTFPGGPAADVDCQNCISSFEIVDGQVTGADIANSAIQSQHLSPNLTLAGNTTVGNLLVTQDLYTGATMDASTKRLTSTGALQNITTITMSGQLTNTVATGTPPFVISSTTLVTNLNADLLDGQHGAFYRNASNLNAGTVPVERLPIATTTSLGVVQVGTGLSITSSGVLSNAGILSVSGVAPISVTAGQSPVISISQASATSDGYLSSADWSTFNAKLSSVATRAGDPFVGNGTSASPLGMTQASATQDGWLSSADWNTFNNKAPGSGSPNYIQNQNSSAQTANFWISGSGKMGGQAIAASFADISDTNYYVKPADTTASAKFKGPVGIGTTTPGAHLDVVGGNIRTNKQFVSTEPTNPPLVVSSSALVTNLNADLLDGQHASAFAPASGSANYIQNQSATAQNASFWISGNATVGGNMTAGAFCLAGDCKTSWSQVTGPWTVSGNNIYNNNTGFVGIGTTSPSALLDVAQKVKIGSDGVILMEGTKNTRRGLEWYYGTNDRYGIAQAQGGNLALYTAAAYAPSFISFNLANDPASAFTELARITHEGRLGLGTTAPVTALQIGNPYSGVASGWPASARQGIMIGQDTDNLFVGLVDEGGNADRAAIIFGDDSNDYLRIMFNNPSAGFTELIRILPDGRVGIGTSSPTQKVDVAGKVNATELCIAGDCRANWASAGTNYWQLSGSALMPLSAAYKVGIGTTNAADVDQLFVVKGTGSTLKFYGNSGGDIYSTGPIRPHFGGSDFNVYSGIPGSGTLRLGISSNGTTYIAPSGGNVGIGSTSAPSEKVHIRGGNLLVDGGILRLADVQGQTAFNIRSYQSAGSLWFYPSSGSTAQLILATSHNWDTGLAIRYTPGTIGAGQGLLEIGQISRNAGTFTHGRTAFYTNGLERMRIDEQGRVGIGTSTPDRPLTVYRSGAAYFNVKDGTREVLLGVDSSGAILSAMTNHDLIFRAGGNSEKARITAGGFLGIGTATPGAPLDVKTAAVAPNTKVAILANAIGDANFNLATKKGVSTNNSGDVVVKLALDYGASTENAAIRFHRGGSSTGGFISFSTNDGTERMRIDASGNVGINRTPSYRLDVNGSTRISGTLQMENNNIVSVNHIQIADPGVDEGIQWLGTAAGWRIDVSDENRGNTDGNLNLYGTANNVVIWRPTKLKGTASNLVVEGTGNSSIAGNLGVGTSSPAARLHVAGDLRVDGRICTPTGCGSAMNYWALSGSNLYPISTGYNLAIGTNDAGSDKLRVAGQIRTTSGGAYGGGALFFGYHSLNSNSNNWLYLGDQNGSVYGGRGFAAGNLWSDSSAYLAVSGGNVGVGTSSPNHKLQVHGNIAMPASGTYTQIPASYARGSRSIIMASSRNADGSGWAYGSRIAVVDYGDGLGTSFDTLYGGTWTNDVLVVSDRSGRRGFVGIGTPSPSDKLDVAGSVRMLTGSNPIRFTSSWTGFPDSTTNQAEISNDTGSYKTLMIVGNKSADGFTRRVGIWDRLDVNGNFFVNGGSATVSNNVTIGGSFQSSVAPATAGVLKVTGGQIAIQQQTSEGNTRIFADFPPYHSWGIYHKNDTNDILFTRRDGSGFFSFSEAGPGGTTTSVVVAEISLDEGNARFYGTVNARAGLCINGDCKTSWSSITDQWWAGDNSTKLYPKQNAWKVGIGTQNPVSKLHVDAGVLAYSHGTNYGTWRNSAMIGTLGNMTGRLLNENADFQYGTTRGYGVYNNSGGNAVQISIISDYTAPNSSGYVMKVSYVGGATSPGYGGYYIAPTRADYITNWKQYKEGNRYVHKIWAKIPVGRSIQFAANPYGTGGNFQWLTSQAGTGNWQEYIGVQTIGSGGTFSSAGHFYISGGAATPFDWFVASHQIIGIDEVPAYDRAPNMNVGYKRGVELGWGDVYATGKVTTDTGFCFGSDCRTSWSSISDAYWTGSGNNVWLNRTGFVGIGTSSPSQKLHVVGGGIFDTSGSGSGRVLTIKNAGQGFISYGAYPWEWSSALQLQSNSNRRFLWMNAGADDGSYNARIRAGNTGLDIYTGGTASDNGNLGLSITPAGNVGIRTTTPGQALEVAGNISLPSSTGDKAIYTWSPTDTNWRIGMWNPSTTVPFNRALVTQHVQAITYSDAPGQGFAVGVNTKNSSFEIRGSDHQAFFRGRVGIQNTAPATALHVTGDIAATGWVGAGCEGACEVSGGYSLLYPNGFGAFTRSISIGTNSDPGAGRLYVTGQIGVGGAPDGSSSIQIFGNPASAFRTAYLDISANNTGASDRPYIRGTDTHLVINGYKKAGGGTLYLNYPGDLTSGTTNTRIQETLFISATGSSGNGNVGIGTSSPQAKLDVQGGLVSLGMRNNGSVWSIPNTCGGSWRTNVRSGIWGKDYSGGCGDEWYIAWFSRGGESSTLEIAARNDGDDHIALMPSGNVGVRTITPQKPLHVVGDVRVDGNICTATECVAPTGYWRLSGSSLYAANTGWNVGIGTTSPAARLDLGPNSGVVQRWTASGGRAYGIEAYDNRFILADLGVRRIFEYDPSGWVNIAAGTNIRITAAGNVGINTSSPNARLDVVGAITARNSSGSNNMVLLRGDDANIGLELRSGSSGGTPYIDFANDASSDYDARIRLLGNQRLAFEGTWVGIGRDPGQPLDVSGNIRASGAIWTTVDSGYAQTYLRTWGLVGDGDIYIEPHNGRTLFLTDKWSATGTLAIQFGRTSWRNASGTERAWVDRDGNASFAGTLTAGNINLTGEIVHFGDGRLIWYGSWNTANNSWGVNRFSTNGRYTSCEGDNDCSSNYVELVLNNNQYRTVLMAHLDWTNTRFFDVFLSTNGGSTYAFHKRIHTYRATTTSNPYTSTIYTIASNLPLGANVRVRVRATRGRMHWEGFSLLKYNIGDTEPNSEQVIGTIFRDAENLSFYVDPSYISQTNDMRAYIFRDLNDPNNYFVDANQVSQLRRLTLNDGIGPCCAGYYTLSVNTSGSNPPTLQFHHANVAEGQIILQGDVGDGGGRGFRFQSVQSDMSGRFTGRVIARRFQDSDNSGCYFDGNDPNGSRTGRLGVQDMTVSGHLDANYARIGRMVTGVAGDDSTQIYSSWLETRHLIPHANNTDVLGYTWAHNWRAWAGVWAYGFYNVSSKEVKKDIRPIGFEDQERILEAVRNIPVVYFHYETEHDDKAAARALAIAELEQERKAEIEHLRAVGKNDDEIKALIGEISEEAIQRRTELRYRPVPHIGVIAEALPQEVRSHLGDGKGYSLADMDGFLLAAIKALEAENRDLRQRVEFLEKVLADKGFFDDL